MTVTLEISPAGIRAVEVRGQKVVSYGHAQFQTGLVRDGLILQPQAVGSAIADLFKAKRISREPVTITIAGMPYSYRIINLPRMKAAIRDEAISRAARREMPVPLEELNLSWQLIRESTGEMEYFVIGVPKNIINALVLTLSSAGIKISQLELKPLALARLAGAGQALVAELNLDSIDVVLVAGGIPLVLHSVVPRPGSSQEDNIRRFLEELGKTVMFYNSTHNAHAVDATTPLFVTGELSVEATGMDTIKTGAEHPIEAIKAPFTLPQGFNLSEYSACLGLALKSLHRRSSAKTGPAFLDINVNLLVNQASIRKKGPSLKSVILPALAILSLALAFTTFNQAQAVKNDLRQYASRVDVFSQMLRQARVESEAARQLAEEAKATRAEAESLEQEQKGIMARRGRYEPQVNQLTRLLPAASWFTVVSAGENILTIEGEAEYPQDVVAFAAAVQGQKDINSVRIAKLDKPQTILLGASQTRVAFNIVVTLKSAS
jgi:hypothetical protein